MQVITSRNFNTNLDGTRMAKQIKKNSFVAGSAINTTARQKYVPVATGRTLDSMTIKRNSYGVELSSLNYSNVGRTGISRYDYTKPNDTYKIGGRGIIPAGKNAGKYQWYDRAYQDIKSTIPGILNEGVEQ